MKMPIEPEDIGSKMDALGLWDMLKHFNFAIKPLGSVFPYFCTVIVGDGKPVKVRLLLLEGWQTMHDFVRTMADRNFGYYLTPAEMPHYEMVILQTGTVKVFRHDPGYVPCEVRDPAQRKLMSRMLWEAYGVMMRIENDKALPLKYAADKAVFARVETTRGKWEDLPLTIPAPPMIAESITVAAEDIKAIKDRPIVADFEVELDFRLCPEIVTREARPRCVYELQGFDAKTHERLFSSRISVGGETGMKGMWESIPQQFVRELLHIGKVPGTVRLCSGRMFRLLRALCIDIPFKLTLHDTLPIFEAPETRK